MNGEVLFEAFCDIDERFIKGAIKMEKKKNYKWVKYAVAAAACLGIGVGAVAVFNQTQNIPIKPADTVVSDTSVSSATSDITLSEPTENSSTTTTTAEEQPANGAWVDTGDNGAQTQPVIPMISSYDSGFIIDEDMAVVNGAFELSYSLKGALKKYGDTVRYRVILEPFKDGAAVNTDDIINASEPERLIGEGYTVALETYNNGYEENTYVSLHAESEQLYNFLAGTEFGYFICLYGERFGNDNNENLTIVNGTAIDGTVPGGSVSVGIDPVKASIAVFPNSEDLSDVADATLTEISETDANGLDAIGSYIPTVLPEGWFWRRGNIYETTMNNGTVYRMMRIRYSKSSEEVAIIGGDTDFTDDFYISITNFEPKTEKPIYSIDELPADIDLSETFHIAVGDGYAIVSADMLTYDEIITVLRSMNG